MGTTIIVYLLYLPILKPWLSIICIFSIPFPNPNYLSNHWIYKFSFINEVREEKSQHYPFYRDQNEIYCFKYSIYIYLGCIRKAPAIPAACYQGSQEICSTTKLEKCNHFSVTSAEVEETVVILEKAFLLSLHFG